MKIEDAKDEEDENVEEPTYRDNEALNNQIQTSLINSNLSIIETLESYPKQIAKV